MPSNSAHLIVGNVRQYGLNHVFVLIEIVLIVIVFIVLACIVVRLVFYLSIGHFLVFCNRIGVVHRFGLASDRSGWGCDDLLGIGSLVVADRCLYPLSAEI